MINAFLFAALCGFLGAGFTEVLFCRVYPMRLKTFTFDWGLCTLLYFLIQLPSIK